MTRERRTRLLRIMRGTLMFGVIQLLVLTSLFAQVTTGNIGGNVKTGDGSLLPGVTITATSPVLQGSRIGYSGGNGDYILRGLPPGVYVVKFEMSGLSTADKNVTVDLGKTTSLDVALSPATKTESITVVASAPSALTTTQLGSNYKQETISNLPIANRTLSNVAMLTPGVNGNSPNAGQIRVNGSFAYDNTFLVDGTDVDDNLFATPHGLYIEDAIAETQVMTGGVSAEYGRFTGGVVNAITKSGGNDISGSLRADYSKPNWTSLNPAQHTAVGIQYPSKTLGKIYQATLGGPVMKDRLWFFLAGRDTKTTGTTSLTETLIPLATGTKNPRYEGKLTGSIANNHTLQASYLTNNTTQIGNQPLGGVIDLRSTLTRELPNKRWALFYNGILTPSLFGEVKYSRKLFAFHGAGGTLTDIHESPFLNATGGQRLYNAPYFDANDPEDRNNNDLTGTLSYFLSTKSTGSHDLKGGYEYYRSTRTGGNSQSATSYVFFADPKRVGGVAIQDANGRFIPTFFPCTAVNGVLTACPANALFVNNWIATRGAKVDLDTSAAFVNDTWNLNKNFSFNLGYRYEKVKGNSSGSITTVDSSRGTPRLGASFDVRADGRTKIDATWGQYSGRYNERQFARNSPVGNPSLLQYAYVGPVGEGIGFAPAFDIANNFILNTGSFPLQNVFVDTGMKSPVVNEFTFSLGQAISTRGFVKATYTNRNWKDFVEDFIDTSTGQTVVKISPTVSATLDNIRIGNTSAMQKKYAALQFLGQYRPISHWTTQLNYTRELKNNGNFVGEAGNQPGNTSLFGDRPELYEPDRHYPVGRLPGYEKDRVRWLNTFSMGLRRFGMLDLGLIYNYDSPLTFSDTATVPRTAQQTAKITNAAGTGLIYRSPPTTTTVFFGQRGSEVFASYQSLDLAVTYSLPLFGSRFAPWVKAEMTNVTNRDTLISWVTTSILDPKAPKDSFGLPTPGADANGVQRTGYLRCGQPSPYSGDNGAIATSGCGGAIFGTPASTFYAPNGYQPSRAYDFSIGVRF